MSSEEEEASRTKQSASCDALCEGSSSRASHPLVRTHSKTAGEVSFSGIEGTSADNPLSHSSPASASTSKKISPRVSTSSSSASTSSSSASSTASSSSALRLKHHQSSSTGSLFKRLGQAPHLSLSKSQSVRIASTSSTGSILQNYYKIVVLGGSGVGKSTLISRFVSLSARLMNRPSSERFVSDPTSLESQVPGLSNTWSARILADGEQCMLDIYDAPNVDLHRVQRRRNTPSNFLIRSIQMADGFVFVYDIGSEESLHEAARLHCFVTQIRPETRIPMILVGNFYDLIVRRKRVREVDQSQVDDLSESWNCLAIEVSSSMERTVDTRSAIVTCFVELTKDIRIFQQCKIAGRDPPLSKLVRAARQRRAAQSRLDLNDIKFSKRFKDRAGKAEVRAGSIEKLVERLSYAKHPNPEYVRTFLLSFRSFSDAQTLFRLLKERFHIQPTSLERAQLSRWEEQVRGPIRFRILNVLRIWVEEHFSDFLQNELLSEEFQTFVENDVRTMNNSTADRLLELFQRKREGREKRRVLVNDKLPRPILSKKVLSGQFHLLDISPLEMARQMSLIDFQLFEAIEPHEWFTRFRPEQQITGQRNHINQLVTKFNLTGAFFARSVLIEKDVKQRAACLKKVIKIAHHSLQLQNYSSTMALVGSLESVNIRRLTNTWALLDRKTIDLYRSIAEICSPTANYATLRKRVLEQTPPLIPYLGVFLSDLTYIHDGNPDVVEGWLINFEKFSMLDSVIRRIREYQSVPFQFKQVFSFVQFLSDAPVVEEAELYRMSLKVEPRPKTASSISRPTLVKPDQVDTDKLVRNVQSEMVAQACKTSHTDVLSALTAWCENFRTNEKVVGDIHFREIFLRSKAVERIVVTLISNPSIVDNQPNTVKKLLELFHMCMMGTHQMQENLWKAVLALRSPNNPLSTKIAVALSAVIGMFKIHPIDEKEALFYEISRRIDELKVDVKRLRMKSGAHSVEINDQQLECIRELVQLQMALRATVQEIIELKEKDDHFQKRQEVHKHVLKLVDQGLDEKDVRQVHEFLDLTKDQLTNIDQHLSKVSGLMPTLNEDTLNIFVVYLQQMYDQMVFLIQRLGELRKVLGSGSELSHFGVEKLVSKLQEELSNALKEDGRRLKSLVMEIDFAEEHATILLRSTLEKQQAQSIYQLLVEIRTLQQEIPEVVPDFDSLQATFSPEVMQALVGVDPREYRALVQRYKQRALPEALSDAVKNQLIFRRSRAFSPEELNFLVTGQDPEQFRATRDAKLAATQKQARLDDSVQGNESPELTRLSDDSGIAVAAETELHDSGTVIAPARCTVRAHLEDTKMLRNLGLQNGFKTLVVAENSVPSELKQQMMDKMGKGLSIEQKDRLNKSASKYWFWMSLHGDQRRLGEDESVYALRQKYPTVHLVLKESVVRKIDRQKMSRLSSVPLPKLPPPPPSDAQLAALPPPPKPPASATTPSRVVRAYVNASDIFDGVVSLARFKTLVLLPGTTAEQLKSQLVTKFSKELSPDHMSIFEERVADFRFFLFENDRPLGMMLQESDDLCQILEASGANALQFAPLQ